MKKRKYSPPKITRLLPTPEGKRLLDELVKHGLSCRQCRETRNPHGLCPIGTDLFARAAADAIPARSPMTPE